MLSLIYNFWAWLVEITQGLLDTGDIFAYGHLETRSIGPDPNDYGIRSLCGSISEPSLFVANAYPGLEAYSSMSQNSSYLYDYRVAVLIATCVYLILICSLNKSSWRGILNIQNCCQLPLIISGKPIRSRFEGNITEKVENKYCFETSKILVLENESDDDISEDWQNESCITSRTDVSMLLGNSIRFKRTPNTGFLQDDYKTSRSAAISLLLWDSK